MNDQCAICDVEISEGDFRKCLCCGRRVCAGCFNREDRLCDDCEIDATELEF